MRTKAGDPSLRDFERLTAEHEPPLGRQTVLNKLNAESVPGWDFVDAFLEGYATENKILSASG